MTAMYQLTQLADEAHRQRLAHAEAQRPAERLLALVRVTRRAERRLRRAARQARRLRAQLQAASDE
jgi:K+-sensing histidine kinase KdpD